MTTKKPDPKKVEDLKKKARSEPEGDINDTLYGARTENQPAMGAGEYNT